jgi:glutamate carboxypeptidase
MDFTSRTPQMISLLKQFVEIESPTHDKAAVNRLGAIIAREAQKIGAAIEIVPKLDVGDQIIARWGNGLGGFLLIGHIDTVHPLGTLEMMPFYENGDKFFGPGVLDMKGGLVIMLTAIAALREADCMPARPITAFFNSDEEMGSYESREIIERLSKDAVLVLVHEPSEPDGALLTWRKGTGKFNIKVKGRAAHSGGAHAKGLNAIEELAHQIVTIQGLTDYEKGTTINIGSVHGGRAINIVPAYAEADGDLRIMRTSEYARIAKVIQSLTPVLKDTIIEINCNLNRPPLPHDATMENTFDRAYAIAREIGMEIKAGGSGSASDANFVAPLGIPVLDGLGPSGEGFHSEQEYILTKSLPERARLTAALLQNW